MYKKGIVMGDDILITVSIGSCVLRDAVFVPLDLSVILNREVVESIIYRG